MINDTTTTVPHPPKAHLGLSTTSWLRPISFDNLAVRTLGDDDVQQVVVSLITTQDLSRLLTVQYDLQQPRHHRSNFK